MLSIVVPVYNAERYLEECLRSLFVQDLSADAYEVIAVDNGSRDGSAALIKQLQNEYSNLRLVTLVENQLPSGARNAGMDAAKGKYLMFLDSDDYLYPNMLQSLVNAIEKENLDFAHFDTDLLVEGKVVKGERVNVTSTISGVELYHLNPKYREVAWSKIYRRDFIEAHHLRCTKGLLYEDFEFAHRLYALATRVRHIDIVPYVFRQHATSTTKNRVNLANLMANLVEINALYDDIYGAKIVRDPKMIQDAEEIIRGNIWEDYRIYPRLAADEQKTAKQGMRKYISRRMLPYMSVKRYVLLKLGIIK
jgi:glycosyltransferase involved in cell wall biosynthesis